MHPQASTVWTTTLKSSLLPLLIPAPTPTIQIPPHSQLTWARWPLRCGQASWGVHCRSPGPWILVHPPTPAPTDPGWGGAGSPGLGQGFLCGTFCATFLPGLKFTFEEFFMSGLQKSESLFVIVITCHTPSVGLMILWGVLFQRQLWIFWCLHT